MKVPLVVLLELYDPIINNVEVDEVQFNGDGSMLCLTPDSETDVIFQEQDVEVEDGKCNALGYYEEGIRDAGLLTFPLTFTHRVAVTQDVIVAAFNCTMEGKSH